MLTDPHGHLRVIGRVVGLVSVGKRIEINVTAFLFRICLEFQKNSGESSKNIACRYSLNLPTPSDRDWSTPRTKHQDTNRAMSSMPYSARKNAINCTLGKLIRPIINVWHNTDVPLPLDKIQQYTYT